MSLFTIQAVIYHYSLPDITDKCIAGCRMNKEQSKNGERRGNKEATVLCHSV